MPNNCETINNEKVYIMDILFYSVSAPYGFLSNFFESPFVASGVLWKTSEHYYQAYKFLDRKIQIQIIEAPTPLEAAIIAHENERFVRRNWEKMKIPIMREAIYHKFNNNQAIEYKLLKTYPARLIEYALDDDFWGCGSDMKGANWLGKLLMEYRQARIGALLSLFRQESL